MSNSAIELKSPVLWRHTELECAWPPLDIHSICAHSEGSEELVGKETCSTVIGSACPNVAGPVSASFFTRINVASYKGTVDFFPPSRAYFRVCFSKFLFVIFWPQN